MFTRDQAVAVPRDSVQRPVTLALGSEAVDQHPKRRRRTGGDEETPPPGSAVYKWNREKTGRLPGGDGKTPPPDSAGYKLNRAGAGKPKELHEGIHARPTGQGPIGLPRHMAGTATDNHGGKDVLNSFLAWNGNVYNADPDEQLEVINVKMDVTGAVSPGSGQRPRPPPQVATTSARPHCWDSQTCQGRCSAG